MNKKIYVNFKLLLIIVLLLLSIILVSAQDSIQFNPGDLVNITGVRCLQANDSICLDTTICYITIINDSNDFLYTNETMNILDNGFRCFSAGNAPNYTTTWSASVDCDNGGVEEFIIEIGETVTDWETAFIVGMIGLISIYALAGFYIFNKEYWLIKSFLYFAAFGMLIVLINSARILAIGSDSITIVTVGYIIGIISLSVMFLYLFVFFFIGIIKSLKEKKGVRWKF